MSARPNCRGRAQAMVVIAALIELQSSVLAERARQVAREMAEVVNGLETAVAAPIRKASA
jgi:hypothetical protein